MGTVVLCDADTQHHQDMLSLVKVLTVVYSQYFNLTALYLALQLMNFPYT